MSKIVLLFQYIIRYLYIVLSKPSTIFQLIDQFSIPIIIINFNQLFYLQQLVGFLLKRGFKNIIIIDNNSTYPPLLAYYSSIKNEVVIERRADNLGHMVFFEDPQYLKKYGKGFYVLTDADIVPNINLPSDFLRKMIYMLISHYKKIVKVGFALEIDDIPNYYPLKEKVIDWERKFWEVQIEEDVFLAEVDTTFALYRPGYNLSKGHFLSSIRLAGKFLCTHGGWYLNPNALTDENIYYMNSVHKSSSWIIDKDGKQKFDRYQGKN